MGVAVAEVDRVVAAIHNLPYQSTAVTWNAKAVFGAAVFGFVSASSSVVATAMLSTPSPSNRDALAIINGSLNPAMPPWKVTV